MSDPNKVWPTGLTEAESEEIHRHLIQGTQFFGLIAALAHLLAYIYSPWLKQEGTQNDLRKIMVCS